MSVLLVDFASAALACLQAVKDKQKLEELAAFDVLDISQWCRTQTMLSHEPMPGLKG